MSNVTSASRQYTLFKLFFYFLAVPLQWQKTSIVHASHFLLHPPCIMERAVLDALFALRDSGCELIWGVMQREREAWERERELLIETRKMVEEREEDRIAVLQRQIDVARGHITVRSVLEKIGQAAYPHMNATDAINHVCDEVKFGAYLDVVSEFSGLSKRDLLKSAKAAYSSFSATLHSGSTISRACNVIPEDVMHNKLALNAVAALFKYSHRDVHFYLEVPTNELRLPSPTRTAPSSPATTSAATTPPKVAVMVGSLAQGDVASDLAAPPPVTSAAVTLTAAAEDTTFS